MEKNLNMVSLRDIQVMKMLFNMQQKAYVNNYSSSHVIYYHYEMLYQNVFLFHRIILIPRQLT
jgi:hypothetical protein